MTTGGWIAMLVSVSAVVLLNGWCLMAHLQDAVRTPPPAG